MLKPAHQIFCDEYLKDGNAARSYTVAFPGVTVETARANGYRMLNRAGIKEYLKNRQEELSTKRIADVAELLERVTRIARGEELAEVVVVESVGDGVSSARRVEKKPSHSDKLKAIDLLSRYYGIFGETHGGSMNITLNITASDRHIDLLDSLKRRKEVAEAEFSVLD